MKTSRTHPLRIDELAVPESTGRIGLTFCPGKKDRHAMTGAWDRDLGADLDVMKKFRPGAVLVLLEEHESELLRVPGLLREMERRDLEPIHLPIPDGRAPGLDFEASWREVSPRLHRMLDQGRRIVIHCRGGLGRTGLVAARLLVERGVEPADAMRLVREARPGSIETREQEKYVMGIEPGSRQGPSLRERIRGCLLAGACGDALGAPVEFLKMDQILAKYGPEGIRDFDMAYGRLGAVTDDTQMHLFTVEGLIRAWVRGAERGICNPPAVVNHAYLRWLATQRYPGRCEVENDGWLVKRKEMWSRRGPGNTCLRVLAEAKYFGQYPENDRKGCGGVMRVAAAGFFWPNGGVEEAFQLGADLAKLTHAHPTGYLAAGFLTTMIHHISEGDDLCTALDKGEEVLEQYHQHQETMTAVRRARELASKGPSPDLVPELGQGWIAEEALAISIYCALAAPSLEESLILAVNHGGDSDSTGAITGNILGALHGTSAIPERWLEQVELQEVMEKLAEDYWSVVGEQADPEELWEEYPGW